MSREFGDTLGGFFHDKIRYAAEDCRTGRDPLTKLWGEFLMEFSEVAYAISTSEACDSGPDFPIFQTLQSLPNLERKLADIRSFVEPYKRVAEQAVRKAVEDRK